METERQVLTIEEPLVIRDVLNVLSAAMESGSCASAETLEKLQEFTRQGCEAVILNMRVIQEPLEECLPEVRGASLVGGVLVVACVVSASWVQQIEELSRHHFMPAAPRHGFASLVRAFF